MDTENRYGTLEMQKYYVPILDDIDQLCRTNDIKYSLSDGTLIGAIRHKGFIPWDDDIDLSFDRENYNKLLKVLETQLPNKYEVIYDMWVRRISRKDNPQKEAIPPEGCIDLFVFDNAPDGKIANTTKNLLLKMLQGMLKREVSYEGFSVGYKVMLFATHWIGKLFPKRVKQNWYERLSQWGNKNKTKYQARYSCSFRYISGVRYKWGLTDEYTEVEFEGKKYMSVKDYDHFLTMDYGDYMTPPSEDKQIPKHIIK